MLENGSIQTKKRCKRKERVAEPPISPFHIGPAAFPLSKNHGAYSIIGATTTVNVSAISALTDTVTLRHATDALSDANTKFKRKGRAATGPAAARLIEISSKNASSMMNG